MKIMNMLLFLTCTFSFVDAGIYSGPANDPTNPYDAPVSKSDEMIKSWADIVVDYSPAPGVSGSFQNPETGFGCLGDLSLDQITDGILPGSITVGFSTAINNGVGFDFAVFENGFAYGSPNGLFMELAYVEVSTNGIDFARFDSISTNTSPVVGSGSFSGWDTSNVYNLAGKHQSGWGTPFDLDQLKDDELAISGILDLDNINFVRLVDIPGSGYFTDSLGNPIYDAFPTSGSAGFDFRLSEGVAVMNQVPEPATMMILGSGCLLIIRRKKCNL